jgi:hypothetical protein
MNEERERSKLADRANHTKIANAANSADNANDANTTNNQPPAEVNSGRMWNLPACPHFLRHTPTGNFIPGDQLSAN